ncbi:unnamed protein product [Dracunculus medinensis]|uniref:long-chain-fatty-acid--CoA ligase n=1 Tax=Dracunculus medinensis TaxID=318479 RepID=A0A3P7QCG3_DRAME|nr:unnamed protein product [Dracunculus medinensis]
MINLLKIWFFVYDCLNYIPYALFNSPAAKLQKSRRIKVCNLDGPWRHVDGPKTENFPGKDTVDKLFTEVVDIYEDKDLLGTRDLLEVHEEKQPNGRIFEKWVLGKYHWQTYREVYNRVGFIAAGLRQITDGKEKDSKVVIFAETRADWLITALACFRVSIPVVTVYATLGEEAISHAICETESNIIVTSAELLNKVIPVAEKCPSLKAVIYFLPIDKSKKMLNLDPLYEKFRHVLSLNELENLSKSFAKKEDIAMIMYTSGTTGAPKGVMITNQNIVASIAGISAGVSILSENDTYIGYLPLAHILEVIAEFSCLTSGCRIGYSSPLTLHDRGAKIKAGTHGDCWALQPTLLAAVPAIMDRIFKAVTEEVGTAPRLMQELFKLNYERKRARYLEGYCSPFLDRIVFKKIRKLLGGKLRGVLSGGAPLNPETQRFMNICMCCPVIQGYGLTETSAAATIADVNDLSTGTVGPPVRSSQIILREWAEGGYTPFNDPPQGEILIGGPNVALGYWKQPEKTAEDFVVIDGVRYFATGDIGEVREDGSFKIIDRKKDLVKLQHGEYVSLGKIETSLLNCPLVDNICAYGCSMGNYVVALIVPSQKSLKSIAEENEELKVEYKKRLDLHAIKNNLGKMEVPKKIYLCDEVWTSESGLLTEALKLKRRSIKEKYDQILKELYSKNGL